MRSALEILWMNLSGANIKAGKGKIEVSCVSVDVDNCAKSLASAHAKDAFGMRHP